MPLWHTEYNFAQVSRRALLGDEDQDGLSQSAVLDEEYSTNQNLVSFMRTRLLSGSVH